MIPDIVCLNRLVVTLLMAFLSLASAFAGSALTGITAAEGYYDDFDYPHYNGCHYGDYNYSTCKFYFNEKVGHVLLIVSIISFMDDVDEFR